MKGVKQLGFRAGNWLSADGCAAVLRKDFGSSLRAKRDYAMLAILFGCGLWRSELVGPDVDDIQMRQGHWAVVDLIGKGGHIRTVPVPLWAMAALDDWIGISGDRRREDISSRCQDRQDVRRWDLTKCRLVCRQGLLRESRVATHRAS